MTMIRDQYITLINKYRNLRTQQMLVHSLVCIFHDMFRPLLVAIFRWFLYLLIDTRATGCINQLRYNVSLETPNNLVGKC
jgi:hypothetical protein